MGQKQRRVDVGGDLSKVTVVPGGLDGTEHGGKFDIRRVPANAEAIAVGGVDAKTGVAALVYQGVLWLVKQLLDEDRGARVG